MMMMMMVVEVVMMTSAELLDCEDWEQAYCYY
jgi:hypothetical protein